MGVIGSRLALLLLASGMAGVSAAQPVVRHAEPVTLSLKAETASFDAYGRRFRIELADNERALQKLPAQAKQQVARFRLLRGTVDGATDSWVRLTESARGVEGAIWDGQELYAVTRYEAIAPYLATPFDAPPGQTVVYRLSDMQDALPRDFCALDGRVAKAEVTALDQYHALMAEIQAGIVTPTLSRQLEISLIADAEFQAGESHDPVAAMMARFNIVEGIFSEQVGLLLQATDVRLMPATSDPFTSNKGATLLEQLGAYRESTAAVRARGVAHLMTGKSLEGTTAGIAYVGDVCHVRRGVSLSQRQHGTTISALIMAHELGHNLGAVHDGTAGTACANVSSGFIMWPSVSGYATFSHCSITQMQAVIETANCVTPVEYADVALEPRVDGVAGEAGRPFTLPFLVRSTGNLAAEDVTLTIPLPAGMAATPLAATASLGHCAISGAEITCNLGDLAEGTDASVDVLVRADVSGNFNVSAQLAASNDRLSANNRRAIPVSLRSGIDAAVAVSSAADETPVGGELELFVDVSSRRALPVRNATLSVNLNQPVISATMAGATCTLNASSLTCAIAEIPAGATGRLTVQAKADTAGPLFAAASVSVIGDGDLNNNKSSANVWVQAERDVEISTTAQANQLSVGTVYEIPFTLRSRGSAPTGDVALLVSMQAPALAVESIEAGGAVCVASDAGLLRCELGPLAPGASRTVVLRVRGTGPVATDVVASALAMGDGYVANNNASVQLRIDHDVDLAVALASGGAGLEGVEFDGEVTLLSQGRYPATGGLLDVELHEAGELRSVRIHKGKACERLSATRARCALPDIARGGSVYVAYSAVFAEPGEYAVTFRATATNDTGPANDELVRPILVRPYLDVAVSGSLRFENLFAGQRRVRTYTISVDRRDLASASFLASHADHALRVEAISAENADCRIDDLGGRCEFVALPAGASIPVKVTWLAGDVPATATGVVSVSTPGDVASGNNVLSARIETFAATDVEVRVGAAVAGASGETLAFPLIELVNGAQPALAPWVEIDLPSGVTLVDVAAGGALCSGTTQLRCDFTSLAAGETGSVSLTVRAGTSGAFTAQVRGGAANDNNPSNDTRNVTLNITGAQPAPPQPPAPKAKGGGGAFEWLSLMLLLGTVPLSRKRGRASV